MTVRRVIFLLMTVLFSASFSFAFDQSHDLWDQWLRKFVVVNGPVSKVRYKAAKGDPILAKYLGAIGAVTEREYNGWSANEKKAFLINVYNAYTVKFILDNYPVKSIKDLGGWFSSPWAKKNWDLFGRKVSLDFIEHDKARASFNEPRLHFAFVCASIGCPQLRGEAWTAAKLEAQLTDATKLFLSDTSRNRYDAVKHKLELSSIFKWYSSDFTKNGESVGDFVAKWITADSAQQQLIQDEKVKIEYLPYDWRLNVADEPRTD